MNLSVVAEPRALNRRNRMCRWSGAVSCMCGREDEILSLDFCADATRQCQKAVEHENDHDPLSAHCVFRRWSPAVDEGGRGRWRATSAPIHPQLALYYTPK